MRDWNLNKFFVLISIGKIFSLPMRDWNEIFQVFLPVMSMIFGLPMRDWNLNKFFVLISIGKIFSLPMRDWNEIFQVFLPVMSMIFSLPMRDWNTPRELEGSRGFLKNFQPTYEGLKQSIFHIRY